MKKAYVVLGFLLVISLFSVHAYSSSTYGSGCYGLSCENDSAEEGDGSSSITGNAISESSGSLGGYTFTWKTYYYNDSELSVYGRIIQPIGEHERVAILVRNVTHFIGVESFSSRNATLVVLPRSVRILAPLETRTLVHLPDVDSEVAVLVRNLSIGRALVIDSLEIPPQLLDITFALEQSNLRSSRELRTTTTFQNFGSDPFAISLAYMIYDAQGTRVYTSYDTVTLFTDRVVLGDFHDAVLPEGSYSIKMTATYAGIDEVFESRFDVVDSRPKWVLYAALAFLLLSFLIFLYRRMRVTSAHVHAHLASA